MSLTSAPLRAALTLVAVVAVAGCTASEPTPQPTPTTDAAPVEVPTTEVTANPVEDDTVLIVRALASASDGSQLSLEMLVHQSTAWDYVGTQTLPQALIDDCGGTVDLDQFAAEAWSFTRVNITAIPTASTTVWPAGATITVEPSAANALTSGRGMLAPAADASTPCLTEKSFGGAGRGGLAIGLPGDSGTYTAWAQQGYGFRVDGATLSECTFEVPELGTQFGAGANWVQVTDASRCAIGPSAPTKTY